MCRHYAMILTNNNNTNILYLHVKQFFLEGKCGAVVQWRKVNQEGVGSNLPMVVLLLKLSRNVEEVRYL